MRNIIFLVLIISLHYNCLAQVLLNKQKSDEPAQTIDPTILRTRNLINSLSQKSPNLFANVVNGNDTTKLEGYVDKSRNLQKLIVKGTNNEGGQYVESVYFDNYNDNIIFSIPFQDGVVNTIFTKKRDVILYHEKENRTDIVDLKPIYKESKISTFMARLDPYLSLLNIKRETVNPSLNSGPVITTYVDSVELREKPINGKIICFLKRHERLFYLGSTKELDVKNNLQWVWYKVATEDKKQIGWVFGHPQYIIDLNDENWEE
ncbi:MAG: hypothetical protein M0R39_11615 [Prolixibacteraceae bacterium]|nr:hypothetical protein [Prolixibacteraceae bacterium]